MNILVADENDFCESSADVRNYVQFNAIYKICCTETQSCAENSRKAQALVLCVVWFYTTAICQWSKYLISSLFFFLIYHAL